MKRFPVMALSLIALLALAACNTVAGVGKDIRQGGEAIEKASGK